jgi:phosphatidylethanolamine/phosphatidyl-N-methylethanolamine N-methyltransferase
MGERDEFRFLRQWLRHPGEIGALLPSGRALTNAIAAQIDVDATGLVVELGAGTGRVTRALLGAGLPPERLIAVERNEDFCTLLRQRFPDVRIVCGEAQSLQSLLQQAGAGPVCAVVSSLPLLTMPETVRRTILAEIFGILAIDGVLIQYTYGLAPPVPADLRTTLDVVGRRTARILANIPPAVVWRYRHA